MTTHLVEDPVAGSGYDLAAIAARASRSSDSGSAGAERLPGVTSSGRQLWPAPPVTLTAARQSRSRTGFPGSAKEYDWQPPTYLAHGTFPVPRARFPSLGSWTATPSTLTGGPPR